MLTRKLLKELVEDELGQDMIEYLLVASLVGFAAVFGLGTLATDMNVAFSKVASKFISALTVNTT